jgi:hypothetical protein
MASGKSAELVSWRDFALWRDDICRVWGKSVVVTMAATSPEPGRGHTDKWTVWVTPLCGRMPSTDDPHISQAWPSSRFTSVPAMLIWCVIELDRLMAEREAERRTQTAF